MRDPYDGLGHTPDCQWLRSKGLYGCTCDGSLDPERLKAWEDGAVNGPFAAFGWNDLRNRPYIQKGDLIDCSLCGGQHTVEAGKSQNLDTGEWEECDLLLFYRCGGKSYLAAISGRKV